MSDSQRGGLTPSICAPLCCLLPQPLDGKTKAERDFEEAQLRRVRRSTTAARPPLSLCRLQLSVHSASAVLRSHSSLAAPACVALQESDVIRKKISKSHRQAIEEYNAKLASLSEHHDIPRVGPG